MNCILDADKMHPTIQWELAKNLKENYKKKNRKSISKDKIDQYCKLSHCKQLMHTYGKSNFTILLHSKETWKLILNFCYIDEKKVRSLSKLSFVVLWDCCKQKLLILYKLCNTDKNHLLHKLHLQVNGLIHWTKYNVVKDYKLDKTSK